MSKKFIFAFLFTLTLVNLSNAQQSTKFWDHVKIGGGLGLSFGNGYFNGMIAPSAIYEFNPKLAAGAGFMFAYAKDSDFYKSTIYGPSFITLFNPIQEIQISAEFEESHVIRNYNDNMYNDENYWIPALYMGIGYRSANATIGIRYDVLYNKEKSINAQAWMPFIRIYF